MTWRALGAIAPTAIKAARLQTHHAAQLLAEVGETHLPPTPDTSHTAMEWDAALDALVTGELEDESGGGDGALRVALVVTEGLKLSLLDKRGETRAALPLAGKTLDEARRWLEATLREHSAGALTAKLRPPAGYKLPAHELGQGGVFALDAVAQRELAHWFANADMALRTLAARERAHAGPLLCWPHHFDHATLLVMAQGSGGRTICSIGAGFSPGDDAIAQPYFYINRWSARPLPDAKPPPLPIGIWHNQSFEGALLTGEALLKSGDALAQQSALARFIEAGVAVNRQLLEVHRRGHPAPRARGEKRTATHAG